MAIGGVEAFVVEKGEAVEFAKGAVLEKGETCCGEYWGE